ncbi:GNAT family N-acetyltransferase [Aeromicrobium sp. CF4.19]|uniref:GNAT family N-acetyltransferase n=1 Tax=Aeromicrobium sp. CF4.19 TaxID=3373082 RepID=UPI003EE63321
MYDVEVGTRARQLERMRALASREWSWSSRWHPGELTWFWWEAGGPPENSRIATWQHLGETVAWAWVRDAGRLDLQIAAAHRCVLEDVLVWFESITRVEERAIIVLDAETELIAALAVRGYQPAPAGVFFAHLSMELESLREAPALPEGYSLRLVDGSIDLARRALLHREVFGASGDVEPSTETYCRLVADDQYCSDLDWMVCSADGTAVAFCLSWLDDSSVAVLEPVGTLLGHRHQGLAINAITASLAAAKKRGATHARVCARADRDAPAASGTYAAAGFTRYARNIRLVPGVAAGSTDLGTATSPAIHS